MLKLSRAYQIQVDTYLFETHMPPIVQINVVSIWNTQTIRHRVFKSIIPTICSIYIIGDSITYGLLKRMATVMLKRTHDLFLTWFYMCPSVNTIINVLGNGLLVIPFHRNKSVQQCPETKFCGIGRHRVTSGLLFIKRLDILRPNLANTRSRENGF